MVVSSQITFLYFKDLAEPARFFEEVLKFKKVEDQGFARIYQTSANAFLGIVDETHGHCRAPVQEQNVLITLVVDDVHGCYDYLKSMGIRIEAKPAFQAKANVECFFFEGPGGYVFEIQKFLNPEVSARFARGSAPSGRPETSSRGQPS